MGKVDNIGEKTLIQTESKIDVSDTPPKTTTVVAPYTPLGQAKCDVRWLRKNLCFKYCEASEAGSWCWTANPL
jgi:hypothetical protein